MKDSFLSRFTPSLMPPRTLETIFVGRQALAGDLMDRLRESVLTAAKHHTLLYGPRGIGKTHLLAMIFHRLRDDPSLKDRLLIAWLREEEYGIASFLDLLLRILRAFDEQQPELGLASKAEEFSTDPRVAESQAEKLIVSAAKDSVLVVLAENLEDIFSGLGEKGQKQLRGYLQNHSDRLCLLATSQSLFGGVSLRDCPFYGFFHVHRLEPLTLQEGTCLHWAREGSHRDFR